MYTSLSPNGIAVISISPDSCSLWAGQGKQCNGSRRGDTRGWQLVSQPVSPSAKQRRGLCVRMSYVCMYVFVSVSSLFLPKVSML